jgi:ribonuclease D
MEDVVAIVAFFSTIVIVSLGVPIVRSINRRKELEASRLPADPEQSRRLERIEQAVEAMAVEIERISEGQRFVTKLLAERERSNILPPRE